MKYNIAIKTQLDYWHDKKHRIIEIFANDKDFALNFVTSQFKQNNQLSEQIYNIEICED